MSRLTSRFLRGTGILSASIGSVYVWDRYANDSTLGRNVRTLVTAGMIISDYKLHFQPENQQKVNEIHTRTASRILKCCQLNGGLYIKFGQQIAQQAAILPPQYNEVLRVMYDQAPIVPYQDVHRIFMEDFGQPPETLFKSFEPEAFASASIAQVHHATLWDGTRVAVKVQKPYIRKQLNYDLFVYKTICYIFDKVFDLPIYWSTEYTGRHLRQEVDFIREGHNAEQCSAFIKQEAQLAPFVHIPYVYWDRTTERILTAEWIEGTSLVDAAKITEHGFSVTEVMKRIVDLFAHQIFVTGFVHCDPHPGNILIRPHPDKPTTPQVVLLDHGLYITESDHFKHQYSLFWKSLFTGETELIKTITSQWGIHDADLFASVTLLRPYRTASLPSSFSPPDYPQVADQTALKARAKQVLGNTEVLPREFIFVGRNMNIVRANNKSLGSPVNRIGRMVEWAVRGLGSDWTNWESDVSPYPIITTRSTLGGYCRYLQFKATLFLFSVTFYTHYLYHLVLKYLYRQDHWIGFEETLDNNIAYQFKSMSGIDLSQLSDS